MAEEPFQSSSQAATCCSQFNHLKKKAIFLSALPKDTTSKLASLSSLYPFNANAKQISCISQLCKFCGLNQ